jgi:hypothetical protein
MERWNMREIYDGDDVIAVTGSLGDALKVGEWNFGNYKSSLLQWGIGQFKKGHRFTEHTHKIRERQKKYETHEFVYVETGGVKVNIYDSNRVSICELYLYGGDYVVTFGGSHGYEVIKDNTFLIEIKNGPFSTVEEDKVKWK